MTSFNERDPAPRRDHDASPPTLRPRDGTAAEYEAALRRETDASLRRDPERWTQRRATDLSFSTTSRGEDGDREESGLRAYVPDADARAAVRRSLRRERQRRQQEVHERKETASQVARRGWETRRRRARAQAQAPPRPS